jgi:hypothetical protein
MLPARPDPIRTREPSRARRPPRSSAAALAVAVLLYAAPSGAADYCISTFSATFVAKGFKLPKKGRCAPWYGFCLECAPNAMTGSACTAADGSHVRFTLVTTTDQADSVSATYYVHLDLPDQTGYARDLLLLNGTAPSATGPVDASGEKCKVAAP